MSFCQEWLHLAMDRFDELQNGCRSKESTLDILEMKLWLNASYVRLIMDGWAYLISGYQSTVGAHWLINIRAQETADRRAQLLADFEDLVQNTDHVLPLPDKTKKGFWNCLRLVKKDVCSTFGEHENYDSLSTSGICRTSPYAARNGSFPLIKR